MEERKRILVIDDDKLVCSSIANVSRTLGYNSAQAFTLEEGLDAVRADPYDIVFLDVRMPDGNGIDIIPQICRNTGSPEVIVITAYGDPDSVDLALPRGAWDYIEKPFSKTDLAQLLKDAVLYHESSTLPQTALDFEKEGIIGHSPGMKKCLTLLSKTLSNDASVLISGETGTGKELFARAIHNHSLRAGNDFVVVDCAALPPNLVESILFGHEKGSYTGADRAQHGLVTQAHKGTLFLDEVGELSPAVQVKLLRFLQEREFQRLGGNQTLRADVRIISATNRDLDAWVKAGAFREHLYYRLKVVTIDLPPLRERKEDIPPLIDHFLRKYAKENGKVIKGISSEARDLLIKYDYPGNVRELENILERAVVIGRDEIISVEDLPFLEDSLTAAEEGKKAEGLLRGTMEEMERKMIVEAMEKAGDHQTKAAEILGISERMLRYKLKKYGLKSH